MILATGINEFVIRFANVNGTGSASANSLIAKCLFRMGLTIGTKNMFPSNIQGMPTWYEIRVSGQGYTACKGKVDLLVAMNGETLLSDSQALDAGAYVLYDSSKHLPLGAQNPQLHYLGLPSAELAREKFANPRQRSLLQNMIYVGALSRLLSLELAVVRHLIGELYGKKPQLWESNLAALELGLNFAEQNFRYPLPFYAAAVSRQAAGGGENKPTRGERILVDGNTALALASIHAGASVCAWYPITPSTSVVEAFSRFCARFRRDKKLGTKKYAIIQAEDEISAIGMVLGASWNGARAFTATSGPGISLMSEFLGYAYYAEIPAVIFNIQRSGPSTGLPTKTQQADLLLCAYASHGDTCHVLLFPANPSECFSMGLAAFDLADFLQTPVLVLSDLEIGMNDYVSPPFMPASSYRPERGKVLRAADLEHRQQAFYRYEDLDGDGVPWRTLPGEHARGAYFTRGSGHDKFGRYTENGPAYQENMERLKKKLQTAIKLCPKPAIHTSPAGSQHLALIFFGSTLEALTEALDLLAAHEGLSFDWLRIKSFPFGAEVATFINSYQRVLVIEQNRDGQLRKLLQAELNLAQDGLLSLCCYDGSPLQARRLAEQVKACFLASVSSAGAARSLVQPATPGSTQPVPLQPHS